MIVEVIGKPRKGRILERSHNLVFFKLSIKSTKIYYH